MSTFVSGLPAAGFTSLYTGSLAADSGLGIFGFRAADDDGSEECWFRVFVTFVSFSLSSLISAFSLFLSDSSAWF